MKRLLSIVYITAACGRAQLFPVPLFGGRPDQGEHDLLHAGGPGGSSHSGGPRNVIHPRPQGPAPWNPATFEAPADTELSGSPSGESIFRKIGRLWSWSRPHTPASTAHADAHVPGWQDAKAWAGQASDKVSSSQTWKSLHLPGSLHAHHAEEAEQESRGQGGGWWGLGLTEPPQTMGWWPNAVQHAKPGSGVKSGKKSRSWWSRLFSPSRASKQVSSSSGSGSSGWPWSALSSWTSSPPVKEQAKTSWWGKEQEVQHAAQNWWTKAQDAASAMKRDDAPWYQWPSLSHPPTQSSTAHKMSAWHNAWSAPSGSSSASSSFWWSSSGSKPSHNLRASSSSWSPSWWSTSPLSPYTWWKTGTSWLSAFTYTGRLGLWVLGKTLTSGGDIFMFIYDVLGCLVLWQMGRTALFGPPVSLAVLGKLGAVLQKAWAALAGTPQAGEAMIWGRIPAQRMRQARLAFACVTIAPIAFIATIFGAFPLLLFTLIARNAIPAGIGLAVATTLHALRHPPFSWVINSTAVSAVLFSYRSLAALAMWSAASNLIGYAWAHFKLVRASIKGEAPPQTEAVQRLSGLPVPMAVLQQQAAQLQGAPPAALTASVSPLSWLDQILLNLGAAATTVEPALDRKLAYSQAVQGAGQQQGQQQQQPQKSFWESFLDTVLALSQSTSSAPSAPAPVEQSAIAPSQQQQPSSEIAQQGQQQASPPEQQAPQSAQQPQQPTQQVWQPSSSSSSSMDRGQPAQGQQSTGASTSESGEAQHSSGSNLKRQSTGNTGSVDASSEFDAQDAGVRQERGPKVAVKIGAKTLDRSWTYNDPTEAVPWWADVGTKSGGPSDEGGGVPSAVLQPPAAPRVSTQGTSGGGRGGVFRSTVDEDFREMSEGDLGAEDVAEDYLSSHSTPKSASGGGGKSSKTRRGASTSLRSAAHQPLVRSRDASHVKQASFSQKRAGADTGH